MLFPVMYEISHYASCCPLPSSHSLQLHSQIFRQGKLYKPQIWTFLCLTRTFSSQPLILQTGPKSETLLKKLASLPLFPHFLASKKIFHSFIRNSQLTFTLLKKTSLSLTIYKCFLRLSSQFIFTFIIYNFICSSRMQYILITALRSSTPFNPSQGYQMNIA